MAHSETIKDFGKEVKEAANRCAEKKVEEACFHRCVAEDPELNVIDASGKFSDKHLPEDLKKHGAECFEKFKNENPCERAKHFADCIGHK